MAVQGNPLAILAAKLAREQRRVLRESLADFPAALKPAWPGFEDKLGATGGQVCKDCGATIKGNLTHAYWCSYWDTEEGKKRSPF